MRSGYLEFAFRPPLAYQVQAGAVAQISFSFKIENTDFVNYCPIFTDEQYKFAMKQNTETRRNFIKKTGIISAGFLGLQTLIASQLISCKPKRTLLTSKYGPLLDDPQKILNLPSGFTYKVIAKKGDKMSDGLYHPGEPDGMATFPGPDGKVIIVRNHELLPGGFGPFGENNELVSKVAKDDFYDFGGGSGSVVGGTTTLVYNETTGEVEKSFLSLTGTIRNCAGGPTPWGSWISCEEYVSNAGNGLDKDHGYCFEVPASDQIGLAKPIPLKALGKFNHEAICVDPSTGIIYLTEDRSDGLFYRFIPNVDGDILQGGRLQALVVSGEASRDTRNWPGGGKKFPVNKPVEVEWIDLEDINPVIDDLRDRGYQHGAARFARGEGIWFGTGELYFACTNGGRNQAGQVFKYTPGENEGAANESSSPGLLELYLEPNDTDLLKSCDNLTVAPWGDLILCEDDPYPFLVGVTTDGELYHFAENVGYRTEFAGSVFSPSGKTLFVNLMAPGITLAIQGPWQPET